MKIGFIGDPHFTSARLAVRKDFFPDTMADKLNQTLEIATAKQCDLWACGGDFRHGRSFSTQYLNKLVAIMKQYTIPKMCVIGNHDCLSEDTELLTFNGWKGYESVGVGDLVYSFNLSSQVGEWVPIREVIIKQFEGEAVSTTSADIDLISTPEHRSLFKRLRNGNRYSEWVIEPLLGERSYRKILKSVVQARSGVSMTDDQLRMVAWILTDGWQSKSGYYISQSKPSGVSRIRELLNRLGYEFTEHTRERKVEEICGKVLGSNLPETTFNLSGESYKDIKKFLSNKRPFDEGLFRMSRSQFEIFIEELVWGDGSFYGKRVKEGTYLFYGERCFLDNVQIMCILNGYSANMVEYRKGSFRLNICKKTESILKMSYLKRVSYKGKMWCLRVKNENFVVRRNGKHFFTGNCENDDPLTVKDTPLGNLLLQGTFGPTAGEWSYETDDALCVFMPFMIDPVAPPPQTDKIKILFAHYFFNDTGYPSDQLPVECTKYYDYIFLGHDHDVHPPVRVGRALVIRPGSLSRGTRHKSNWDRDVYMAYLDTAVGECEYIPLRCLPAHEIFSEARLRREKELKTARDVSGLTESVSISDPSDVQAILDESIFPEAVKKRTAEWLRSVNLI